MALENVWSPCGETCNMIPATHQLFHELPAPRPEGRAFGAVEYLVLTVLYDEPASQPLPAIRFAGYCGTHVKWDAHRTFYAASIAAVPTAD